jgi:hypothetical protein
MKNDKSKMKYGKCKEQTPYAEKQIQQIIFLVHHRSERNRAETIARGVEAGMGSRIAPSRNAAAAMAAIELADAR